MSSADEAGHTESDVTAGASAAEEAAEAEAGGVRITDRRLIDPETGEARQRPPASPGAVPGADAGAAAAASAATADSSREAELTEDLQRVTAEYANYRKRVDRDRELVRQVAVSQLIAELMPVLDDIDRAREHEELTGAFKTVAENLESTLAKSGLERFGEVGEPFDPAVHEAMTHESDTGAEVPTCTVIYQPGYRLGERIIRPARVQVSD